MRTHILIAALLTVSALALAACGKDPAAGGGTAGDRKDDMQQAALKYAKCMREHGIDMPDPKPGARGIMLSPPKGVSPSKARAADEACRKYLDAVKPPELTEEQQKEFRTAALAHAQCMREHGIDMPDPTFGANGEARVHIGPGSGIDPNSAKFKDAQEACQSKLPKPSDEGEGPSTEEASP